MQDLTAVDQDLAKRYGPYASYKNDLDPEVETFGDSPIDEVDRLLDSLTTQSSVVLDLGCGAGFTTCRVATKAAAVWGFDMDGSLLSAAKLRAEVNRLKNATFVQGNVAVTADVEPLPDDAFDLVISRRGPNVNNVLPKMKANALVIQELFQGYLGLLEVFGRKSFLVEVGHNPRWLIDAYASLNLFPVSAKEYYLDYYFRDIDHLVAYLSQATTLYEYPLPPMPYDEARDRQALELYARYNQARRGIRIVNKRNVYLFRHTPVLYAPAAPEVQPEF